MNQKEEKITPLKNAEDYEKLKAEYQDTIQAKDAEIEKWKNTAIKSDKESLVKDKVIERLTEEKDDWKTEATAARKVEIDKKKNQHKNSVLEEFYKLQENKRNTHNNL